MMFVSRATVEGAGSFRVAVGAGEFDGGGVCVNPAGAPGALRFLERLAAAPGVPGVDSFVAEPLEGAPLLFTAMKRAKS